MTASRTIAMLGLPRTGKSTYLGALWRLVQDIEVPDISERDFTGDRSRINQLAANVSRGIEIERTEVDSDDGFDVEIGFGPSSSVGLRIPDLSGEASRELVEERIWRRSLAHTLQHADAILLFVHPDRVDAPVPAGFAEPAAPEESDPVEPEFAADDACTAAKLVELLENVIELCADRWPIPLVVMVSAWDRVVAGISPAEWLEQRLPGVAGFVFCNPRQLRPTIFGVSAQGGHLPTDRDSLIAKGGVRQRVFAVDRSGRPVELWEPLRWALESDT